MIFVIMVTKKEGILGEYVLTVVENCIDGLRFLHNFTISNEIIRFYRNGVIIMESRKGE